MSDETKLPPGQYELDEFPRFGLSQFASRFPSETRLIVEPRARPARDATLVILRSQDGYVASLPLADLLAGTVLLADRLIGEPLTVAHGAPLRLLAPAHYGYKNPKHVNAVEFWRVAPRSRRSAPFRFMDHPRARVALEERGTGAPGWLLRHRYRPLVRPGIWWFRRALAQHSSVESRIDR